ncbi:Outer membrane efflux protein [compost metagenome]
MAPIRIARLQEEINRLQLEATVAGTVSAVIASYRGLILAQEQVRLAEEALERTRALLETNRALIQAGRMAEADIVQTEFGVANQEVAVLQSRQQVVSAQLALLHLLALASRTNVVAVDPMQADRVDVDLERAMETAFASRIDLLAQRKALEQMRQSMIVARNQRLWDVSLVASATRDDGPRFWGRYDETDTTVGLQLSIPIGDLSRRQNWLTAETGMQIAELAFEEMKQSVESQVLDAVRSVEASWRQVEAARRARALSARALDIGQEKLRFGRASNFEVLSLQADLRAADAQELSANITYLNALTALDQQIGSTLETWRISLND